jgi:hypothetical protein
MSDMYEKVTDDQDPITKLASKIPGFKGYIESSTRRAADALLRETIKMEYDLLHKRVSRLQEDLANSGELEHLAELETATTKLQTFIDKVDGAARGYSGFFDAVKVDQDALAKIYEYDVMLLESATAITSAIDNVEQSMGSDGMPAAVRHLVTLCREIVDAFEKRSEVIKSL